MRRLLLSVLSAGLVAFLATGQAQAVEGCDPKVMNALNAKAQAKVAYDVAVAEEIIKQPDSVLALTCFAKSAAHSAREGGKIFSNEGEADGFIAGLSPTISEALESHYSNYKPDTGEEGPPGFETGTVDYDMTNIETVSGVDCASIGQLWTDVKEGNINEDTPYATFDDLRNNIMPSGAGETFTQNWQNSVDYLDDLDDAMDDLPRPSSTPNFNGAETVCDVLTRNNGGTAPPGC